jgi:hypothetical protein
MDEKNLKVVKCRITDMPKTIFDPMPIVFVTLETGDELNLFSYYPDEISFHPDEFVGLTVAECRGLKGKKDLVYLRS